MSSPKKYGKKKGALKLEAELVPGIGINRGMLERFFESLGMTLTTVKVVLPKRKARRGNQNRRKKPNH